VYSVPDAASAADAKLEENVSERLVITNNPKISINIHLATFLNIGTLLLFFQRLSYSSIFMEKKMKPLPHQSSDLLNRRSLLQSPIKSPAVMRPSNVAPKRVDQSD
jgi:hypothetical protein